MKKALSFFLVLAIAMGSFSMAFAESIDLEHDEPDYPKASCISLSEWEYVEDGKTYNPQATFDHHDFHIEDADIEVSFMWMKFNDETNDFDFKNTPGKKIRTELTQQNSMMRLSVHQRQSENTMLLQ